MDESVRPELGTVDQPELAGALEGRPSATPAVRSRRALIMGALGGVAGLIAGRLARPGPAAAAAGSALIIGSETNNAGTSDTQLITNSSTVAFKLLQNSPSTALMGYVTTTANAGGPRGVYGRVDSPNGDGIQGRNAGAAGTGAGIRAFGGNNTGVIAEGAPAGVVGTGTNFGVRGASPNNYGLFGEGGYAGVFGSGPYGVYGSGDSAGAIGTSGPGYGLYGLGSTGAVGIGDGNGYGVWGYNGDSGGTGVVGQGGYRGVSATGGNAGVFGSSGYVGVWGSVSTTEGLNFGVYGYSGSPGGYAGVFSGAVQVSGFLSKLGGGFKIDHPQDPDNRYLVHSFVESPEMLNVYGGTVKLDAQGRATVPLPAYFAAENREHRFQLTAIGGSAPDLHVAQRVVNNQFKIAGGSAGLDVCWQVTGIRQDAWANANPMEVEPMKAADDRKRYLAPRAHGKPESASIYALEHRFPAEDHPVPRGAPANLSPRP